MRALNIKYGANSILATDITEKKWSFGCDFRYLNVLDKEGFFDIVREEKVSHIIHLAIDWEDKRLAWMGSLNKDNTK